MSTNDSATVAVTIRAHPVSRWILVLCARPYVAVDDREPRLSWSRIATIPVESGGHKVRTFVRYRGSATPLGIGTLSVCATPGDEIAVYAQNGYRNGSLFQPRIVDAFDAGDP